MIKIMHKVVYIQSQWRAIRCRRKVQYFSNLPCDLWSYILYYLRKDIRLCAVIDNIIRVRVIRLKWMLPRAQLKKKLQTILLIRKYQKCFSKKTLSHIFDFLIRLLEYSFSDEKVNFLINACIEDITDHCIQ